MSMYLPAKDPAGDSGWIAHDHLEWLEGVWCLALHSARSRSGALNYARLLVYLMIISTTLTKP